MYGDPAHLDEIAVSLDARADEIQRTVHRFLARVGRAQWYSVAASTMRARASDLVADFADVARRYREAAEAVRRHAREVRQRLALILDIERKVKQLVDDAWDRVQSLGAATADVAGGLLGGAKDVVSGAMDGAGDLLGVGGDPPAPDPADLQLCAQSWPPPGHLDWLQYAQMPGVG